MCFIGCNKSEKQNVKQVQMNTKYNMYMTDINISGSHYKLIQSDGQLQIINITNDSLKKILLLKELE